MKKLIEKQVGERKFIGEIIAEKKLFTKGSKYFNPVHPEVRTNYTVQGFVNNVLICHFQTPVEASFMDLVTRTISIVEDSIDSQIKNLSQFDIELQLKDLGFENLQDEYEGNPTGEENSGGTGSL